MNKTMRFFLRTALNLMDQYTDHFERASDRVSDRVSDMVDRGKEIIYPPDHTLRNLLSFAAGVGVGIGAGLLLAPSSGNELRQSIKDRVRGIDAA